MPVAASVTAAGGVVALTAIRPGPHLEVGAVTPKSPGALAVFAERGPRFASLGYFGHMWELYALWTWLAVFIANGRAGTRRCAATSTGSIAFGAIGIAGSPDVCWAGGHRTASVVARRR